MQNQQAMSHARSGWLQFVFGFLLYLALPTVLLAQSDNAQISGFIKDPTGAAVPSAELHS